MIIFSRASDTGGKRANAQLVTFINRCCKGHGVSLDVRPHPKACLPRELPLRPPPTTEHPPPRLFLLAPVGEGQKPHKHTSVSVLVPFLVPQV